MDRWMAQILNEGKDEILFELPDGATLIEDAFSLVVKPGSLVESNEDGVNRYYLDGPLGLTEVATLNKRLYRRYIMEREIKRLSKDMGDKKIYGELDHPGDGKTKLSRVSHFVLNASVNESNEIMGRIELIPGTVGGDQAIAIARAGGVLGVSSRGFGTITLDTKGNHVVQEDYRLVTWDIVADPANSNAFPNFVTEDIDPGTESNMTLKELKEKHPEIVEELRREFAQEAGNDEELRSVLGAQHGKDLAGIREEAVEQARDEILESPDVQEALSVIDDIREHLSEYAVTEDGDINIEGIVDAIDSMSESVTEYKNKVGELSRDLEEVAGIAKTLGFQLFLEKQLGEEAGAVIEGIGGDLSVFDDLESLKVAVSDVLESIARREAARQEYQEEILVREREIEARDREIQELKEQRDEALSISAQFGSRAYLEQRLIGHPRASGARKYVLGYEPSTKSEVDRLIESYDIENPVSSEYKAIRKGISLSKIARSNEDRQRSSKSKPEGKAVMVESIDNVCGVPIEVIKNRSSLVR